MSTVLLLLGAVVAYRCSPQLLTIDSGLCKADAIIVLGGDAVKRPIRAAELFKAGAAPFIIASGNGDCDDMVAALEQHGVPKAVIRREDMSGSTKQNAEFSVSVLRQELGPQTKTRPISAIIVTSWYHSRRALKTFRKTAPEFRFYSRPCYAHLDRTQWTHDGTGTHIRLEFMKLGAYWLCYGICPF